MENIRNRVDIRFVTDSKQAAKVINKPNFERRTIFCEKFVAVHMNKIKLKFDKPIYLGSSILDLSKNLMYEFHYDYIKPKYGEKVNILYKDTDSLIYEIETDDFYRDISLDVGKRFDTGNFPKVHPSGIETGINKKVIGMFKDEVGGNIISEFVALRSKSYSFKVVENEELVENKKCKGIAKATIQHTISFQDYRDCLFSGIPQMRKMNTIKSHLHEIFTEEMNKIALCNKDDKRIIQEDGINTCAYGHFKLLEGGNSESSGTTCNSSRTKPCLGPFSK